MNVTLSLNEATVERAREVARQQGTSLNQLVREYVELLAGQLTGDEVLAQFESMWKQPGNSGGKRFRRDELYEERLDRHKPR
jgi:Family of unknown function (DUF6364)